MKALPISVGLAGIIVLMALVTIAKSLQEPKMQSSLPQEIAEANGCVSQIYTSLNRVYLFVSCQDSATAAKVHTELCGPKCEASK